MYNIPTHTQQKDSFLAMHIICVRAGLAQLTERPPLDREVVSELASHLLVTQPLEEQLELIAPVSV